jgi:DNA-binding transcriptional MerR regulator
MRTVDAPRLVSIGTFASLGGVSIKALRLYADLGLLIPAARGPASRYRLYARGQLARLHRILLLKSVGVPLRAIRGQLDRPDREVLLDVRGRLERRLQETRRQLTWVHAQLDGTDDPAADATACVVVKDVPRLVVRSERQRIRSYEQTDDLLDHLGQALPKAARVVAGAVWHACRQKTGIDCEAFWVVAGRIAGAVHTLEPVRVASALHCGDDQTIAVTYAAIRRWIRGNGFRIAGPNREIYLDPDGQHAKAALTEVQFPIRARALAV